MKTLVWIAGIVAVIIAALWGLKKFREYANRDNAADKDERQANIIAETRGQQAIASYPDVLPPSASWVRMGGPMIDLNRIGGVIPDLYTLPSFTQLTPNG